MTKFSWGCHTCDKAGVRTFHYSRWGTRFAKRKSIRHERDVHGFSVYDPAPVTPLANIRAAVDYAVRRYGRKPVDR